MHLSGHGGSDARGNGRSWPIGCPSAVVGIDAARLGDFVAGGVAAGHTASRSAAAIGDRTAARHAAVGDPPPPRPVAPQKEVFTGAAPSAKNDNNRRNVGAIVSEVIPKYGPFTDPEASAAVRYAKEVKALLG